MPAFITFGRILFAVIFYRVRRIQVLDLSATADVIANKVIPTIPRGRDALCDAARRAGRHGIEADSSQSPLQHWNWSAVSSSR